MSIARQLTVGSIARTAAQITTAVTSYLLVPIIAHKLGDRSYGLWSLLGAFMSYSGLLQMGMTATAVRYLSQAAGSGDFAEYRAVFNTAFRLHAVVASATLLLGSGVAAVFPRFAKTDAWLWQAILVSTVNVSLFFFTRLYYGTLAAEVRYGRAALLDLLLNLGRSFGIFAAVLGGYGLLGMFWASLVGSIPSYVLCYYFVRRDVPAARFMWYAGVPRARKMASFGFFTWIGQLADVLRFQVDAPVVAAMISVAAVAHYRVAGISTMYAMELLVAALGMFGSVFSRQEGRNDYEAIRRTFVLATKVSLSASSFVAFGLIAWGRPFIERWMGAAYLDAYPCLVWLAAACLFNASQLPANSLLGVSRHRLRALLSLVEGAVNLAMSIVLARQYGIAGVAMGTAIPMFVSRVVVQPFYACRLTGLSYAAYARAMARSITMLAFCVAVCHAMTYRLVAPDYRGLFLAGIVAVIAFVPLQWGLMFDVQERSLILSGLRIKRHRAATTEVPG